MSKTKIKTKPPAMKHHGIRFTDETWNNMVKDAEKDKSGKTTASDVARHIIDAHYEAKKKKPL